MFDAVLFPDTQIQLISRYYRRQPCPKCATSSPRRSEGTRRLRHLGLTHPVVLEVRYSKHLCPQCQEYFNAPMDDLAEPASLFTKAVQQKVLATVLADHLPLRKAIERMLRDFFVHVPLSTLHGWVEQAGGKNPPQEPVRAVGP